MALATAAFSNMHEIKVFVISTGQRPVSVKSQNTTINEVVIKNPALNHCCSQCRESDVCNALQGRLKRNKFQLRNELPDLKKKTGWMIITAILLLQEKEWLTHNLCCEWAIITLKTTGHII